MPEHGGASERSSALHSEAHGKDVPGVSSHASRIFRNVPKHRLSLSSQVQRLMDIHQDYGSRVQALLDKYNAEGKKVRQRVSMIKRLQEKDTACCHDGFCFLHPELCARVHAGRFIHRGCVFQDMTCGNSLSDCIESCSTCSFLYHLHFQGFKYIISVIK